jgi:hypothetical protein
MDLERLHDPRIVTFMVQVLTDPEELAEVRIHVVKRLRDGRAAENRTPVAQAMMNVLADHSSAELRLQTTLALAEFGDVDGVPRRLGGLALQVREPLDLRYSAFTSLERAGPISECVAILRQLLPDESLGPAARSLLAAWRVE